MNEVFLEKLYKIINSREEPRESQDKRKLLDNILEFSRECYIHGVTAGINAAIEIYENN